MPKIFEQFPEIRSEERIVEMDDLQKQNSDVVLFRDQLHSDISFYVSEYIDTLEGDGLFTDKSGIKLGVRTADCLPALFYNPKAGVVGAVHAGWRGTEKKVLKKTIQKVIQQFECDPSDFYFYFGPAAQKCCHDKDFVNDNKKQLLEIGVLEDLIEISSICTVEDHEYPSNVREKQDRKKSMISIIERV